MFTTFAAYVDKCEMEMQRLFQAMEKDEEKMSTMREDDPREGDYFFNDIESRKMRVECAWRKKSDRLWEFFDSFHWFAHHQPLAYFEYELQYASHANKDAYNLFMESGPAENNMRFGDLRDSIAELNIAKIALRDHLSKFRA